MINIKNFHNTLFHKVIESNNLTVFLEKTLESPTFNWRVALETILNRNCSVKELAQALLIVKMKEESSKASKDSTSSNYSRLTFELKELLFRAAFTDEDTLNELVDFFHKNEYELFAKQLEELRNKKTLLSFNIPQKTATNKQPFEGVHFNSSFQRSEQLTLNTFPRVLHASLEYHGAEVAGVAVVSKELTLAQKMSGQDSRIITPLYDTYIQEKSEELQFISVLSHVYEGAWYTSSVYQLQRADNPVIQYLIKPDESYISLFDLHEKNNVYKDFFNGFCDRTQFFVSAVAAFASSHVGTNGDEPFDILHLQSWSFGLGAALIKSHYNPMREASFIAKPLAVVSHIHGYGINEQGRHFPHDIFQRLGLLHSTPSSKLSLDNLNLPSHPNLQLHAYSQSDGDIHVSIWQAHHTITQEGGYGLDEIASEKLSQKRMYGIANGVFSNHYRPTNRAIYGDFAYRINVTEQGIDATDYVSQRNMAKSALFERGIIASKEKPLFLYVGRLEVPTKGVDALPSMVHKIHDLGGQCVVMGKPEGAEAEMRELEELERIYPNSLKFYKNPERDQRAPFDESAEQKVEKGKLIRLASDFVVIPSHREPDGLVPKESLITGALLITSGVDGLAATAKGRGDVDEDEFNAFTYRDDANFKANAADALSRAMSFWNDRSTDKNQLIRRLIASSDRFDWRHTIEKINEVYRRAMVPQTVEEKQKLQDLEKKCYERHFYTQTCSQEVIDSYRPIGIDQLRARAANDRIGRMAPSPSWYHDTPLKLAREEIRPFVRYAAACAAVHGGEVDRWLLPFDGGTFRQKAIEGPFAKVAEDLRLKKYEGFFFDPSTGLKAAIFESEEEVLITFGAVHSLSEFLWVAEGGPRIEHRLTTARLHSSERAKLTQRKNDIIAQQKMAFNAQKHSFIAQNLLGFLPKAFHQADELVFRLRSLFPEEKPIRVVGQCIAAALASYSALSNGLEARCFNSMPLGSGAQAQLGQELLQSADERILHIGAESDYVSDNRTLQPLFDKVTALSSFPLPKCVGLRCSIPTAYTDQEETHIFILGSMMEHLGYRKTDAIDVLFSDKG